MDRHKIILINFNEEKKYQFIIEDFTPDTKIFLTEHKLIYSSSYSLTFVLIADPREEYFSIFSFCHRFIEMLPRDVHS